MLEQTVHRNMDIKHPTGEDSEGSKEHGRENTNFLREYQNHCEWSVSKIIDVKGIAGKGSEGNEEHVIGKLEGR